MMEIVDVVQGSQEWLKHRAKHFNASDAPAMMGVSPYMTRDELLKQYHTGIVCEVSPETQLLFAEGHRCEALARPFAEEFLREDLTPCVGTREKMSASFDGLTLTDEINWEHKILNNEIRAAKGPLLIHKIQMEHQMFVAGRQCDRSLFTASSFDLDGNPLEIMHAWYDHEPKLQAEVLAGWLQFEKDLANFKLAAPTLEPVATVVRDLPTANAQVEGRLVACNLASVTPYFDRFLAEAVTDLITDDDFSLAESQSKVGRKAAKECRFVAKSVVDQMQSVALVSNTLNMYADKLDALALAQEKAVKTQKEQRKTIAKLESDKSYQAHIASLNAKLGGVRLVLHPQDQPDFINAMKNQRRLDSLYGKLADELARAKICADRVFNEYCEKLDWFLALPGIEGHFPDLQTLVQKPLDDFKLGVTSRIQEREAAAQKRLEAERDRIRAEEEAKLLAKAEIEKKKVERERLEAEARTAREKSMISYVSPVPESAGELESMPFYESDHGDEIDEFIALGGIPDDLVEFVRLTLTRFIAWRTA